MRSIKKIYLVFLLAFFGLSTHAKAEVTVLQSSDFVGNTF